MTSLYEDMKQLGKAVDGLKQAVKEMVVKAVKRHGLFWFAAFWTLLYAAIRLSLEVIRPGG